LLENNINLLKYIVLTTNNMYVPKQCLSENNIKKKVTTTTFFFTVHARVEYTNPLL